MTFEEFFEIPAEPHSMRRDLRHLKVQYILALEMIDSLYKAHNVLHEKANVDWLSDVGNYWNGDGAMEEYAKYRDRIFQERYDGIWNDIEFGEQHGYLYQSEDKLK